MEGLILFVLFVVVVLPMLSFILVLSVRHRLLALERLVSTLEQSEGALRQKLRELENSLRTTRPGPTPSTQPEEKIGAPAAAGRAVTTAPVPETPAVKVSPPPAPTRPAESPVIPVPGPGHPPKPIAIPPPVPVAEPQKPPPAAQAAPGPRTPRVPPPQSKASPAFDWEGLVGVKLFSWIAGIALTLAAVFFLRYSIERGWLSAPIRMTIGVLVGMTLLVLCELKAAGKYRVTANALDAAGIAILFSTLFAANALWHLVGPGPTFFLLVLVTAAAVLLSIRHDSMFIALLGLLGGFATPALLSTGEDRPVSLFGYLLLLNAGLALVAHRKRWNALTVLCLVCTTIYQWVWVGRFLGPDRLPLAAGIFLVFPILSFAALVLTRGEQARGKGWSTLSGQTANISAALPLLFALYMAVVPGYGERFGILFGFLLCLDVGLFAIALMRGPEILHGTGALTTLLVFAVWLRSSYSNGAWPAILAFVAAFVLFYISAPLAASRLSRGFKGFGAQAVFAAPLLLFVFPTLAFIEKGCASPGLLFAVLMLLVAVIATQAIFTARGAVYYIAAFFVLATEAAWSATHLEPARLLPALAIYGVFGLFFLAVPLSARLWKRPLAPEAGSGLVVLGSILLLFFLTGGPIAQNALWGLALLLSLLCLGLLLLAGYAGFPLISIAGLVLSWLVLGVWWSAGTVASILLPALFVIGGFSLLTLGGSVWLVRKVGGIEATGIGPYLAITGHLFLLFAALQRPLAVPPWPIFGLMLVLDLAIGAAALWLRSGNLQLGAISTSALVIGAWASIASESPWPRVAILSALFLVAFSLVWMYLARRTQFSGHPGFIAAAVAAAFMGQGIAMVAANQPGAPSIFLLLTCHLVLVSVLLWLSWQARWHVLPLLAVITTGLAGFLLQVRPQAPWSWREELLFSVAMYVVFLAYPLVLGRKAGRLLQPYLAAILAGGVTFFLARQNMLEGGLDSVIGVLPIAEALLTCLLLVQLLRLEPPGERVLGRLAIVAGAALAFVTVAIPLQLEKEWITIGWALEGAALAWLYGRIPHRGLFYASSGLLATVFVRLALNPSVFEYQARGLRIWNWYLYTYLICAVAIFAGALFLSRTRGPKPAGMRYAASLLTGGGTILLFLLLNIEIADFYSGGPTITFNFSATLAQDLTYTLGWAVFALGLLGAGLVLRSRPGRIAALLLLVATILKCFLHDLGRLGGLYRVGSFVGLAVCLALVALLLQRFVLSGTREGK
jgi:uncharacterized membrane protein